MTTPLPHPRWLSFDCYGTLIDWEAGIRRCFREAVRVRAGEEEEMFRAWERNQWEKIQATFAPYAGILESSFCETLEQFGYRCSRHSVESFLASVARWEPFPEVNAALSRLSQRFKLAIISNTDRELLGCSLRHFPVRFDALITAEDAKAYKPNPEIFRYALKILNCPPQEVLHVAFGSDYDLSPAGSAGFRLAFLNRSSAPPPPLPLEAELTSLEDLVRVLGDT